MRIVVSFENPEQLEAFRQSLAQNFEGDFNIEKVTQEENNQSLQLAVEPHLYRGINDKILEESKEKKDFYKGHVVEIRDQAIKKEVEEDPLQQNQQNNQTILGKKENKQDNQYEQTNENFFGDQPQADTGFNYGDPYGQTDQYGGDEQQWQF